MLQLNPNLNLQDYKYNNNDYGPISPVHPTSIYRFEDLKKDLMYLSISHSKDSKSTSLERALQSIQTYIGLDEDCFFIQDKDGNTISHYAFKTGSQQILKVLDDRCLVPDCKNNKGELPTMQLQPTSPLLRQRSNSHQLPAKSGFKI